MQHRQEITLNQSRHPARRAQVQPGPVSPASSSDIADLLDSVITLNQAVTALQARVSDLEDRLRDLGSLA